MVSAVGRVGKVGIERRGRLGVVHFRRVGPVSVAHLRQDGIVVHVGVTTAAVVSVVPSVLELIVVEGVRLTLCLGGFDDAGPLGGCVARAILHSVHLLDTLLELLLPVLLGDVELAAEDVHQLLVHVVQRALHERAFVVVEGSGAARVAPTAHHASAAGLAARVALVVVITGFEPRLGLASPDDGRARRPELVEAVKVLPGGYLGALRLTARLGVGDDPLRRLVVFEGLAELALQGRVTRRIRLKTVNHQHVEFDGARRTARRKLLHGVAARICRPLTAVSVLRAEPRLGDKRPRGAKGGHFVDFVLARDHAVQHVHQG
mmetsp:Transcript_51331/g.121641  ORF Transcript_51331/g.121641 Transcript_51331/m.121641 type:complete len:319 (-) Transcript_51331:855-1811(-)